MVCSTSRESLPVISRTGAVVPADACKLNLNAGTMLSAALVLGIFDRLHKYGLRKIESGHKQSSTRMRAGPSKSRPRRAALLSDLNVARIIWCTPRKRRESSQEVFPASPFSLAERWQVFSFFF